MKPLIGLCGSVNKEETQQFLLRDYFRAILDAGGLPVLLSLDMDESACRECLSRLDGLMLAGGNDVDPVLYGQRPIEALCEVNPSRDGFEMTILRQATASELPVLGICRGVQVMNAAMGGTLYQDLPTERASAAPKIGHRQSPPYDAPCHSVTLCEGSKLHQIEGAERLSVNSMHHQALRDIAPGLTVCARAEDGLVEAVEQPEKAFFLGVQWHPERMPKSPAAQALFGAFVAACERYAGGKRQ